MNPVTAAAFFDELTKIAKEGSPIGRLVNADVGANQFPDAQVGDTPKRSDRAIGAAKVTTSSPNPEDRVPAPEEQYT